MRKKVFLSLCPVVSILLFFLNRLAMMLLSLPLHTRLSWQDVKRLERITSHSLLSFSFFDIEKKSKKTSCSFYCLSFFMHPCLSSFLRKRRTCSYDQTRSYKTVFLNSLVVLSLTMLFYWKLCVCVEGTISLHSIHPVCSHSDLLLFSSCLCVVCCIVSILTL